MEKSEKDVRDWKAYAESNPVGDIKDDLVKLGIGYTEDFIIEGSTETILALFKHPDMNVLADYYRRFGKLVEEKTGIPTFWTRMNVKLNEDLSLDTVYIYKK